MKHTIHVKQRNIDKAVWQTNYRCPVALAIRDVLPSAATVQVCPRLTYKGGWYVNYRLDDYSESRTVPLPEPAAQLARDFDNRRPAAPMSFELEIP